MVQIKVGAQMKKKVIIFFIIPTLCLLFAVFLKVINIEIWEISIQEKQVENNIINLASFVYNEEVYYELEDLRKLGLYENTFTLDSESLSPYYLTGKKTNNLKYVAYGKDIFSILCADSFFMYENDFEKNIIFIENKGPGGPSDGWIYIKEGYEFPTADVNDISSIFITINNTNPNKSNIVKINSNNYNEMINAIKSHKDFQNLLPCEDWIALYIEYKNSPLTEKIAKNDDGVVNWQVGGTP